MILDFNIRLITSQQVALRQNQAYLSIPKPQLPNELVFAALQSHSVILLVSQKEYESIDFHSLTLMLFDLARYEKNEYQKRYV